MVNSLCKAVECREGSALRLGPEHREGLVSGVALLGATFQSGNHGLSALASGSIASLRHAFKAMKVAFVDYGRESVAAQDRIGQAVVAVDVIALRFSRKPWQANHIARLLALAVLLRYATGPRLRRKLSARSVWLRRLCEPDVYLSLAGGDSFSDIYGLLRLLYMALPQILALALDKPLVLLPQTYGPFKGRVARSIARYILRRARCIYSRDREGVEVVKELLGERDGRVKFAYDMGFALEPMPPGPAVQERLAALRQRGRLIGFNVSGLLYMGGYSRDNMFGLRVEYRKLVRTIIERLAGRGDIQVLLVPHVFGDDEDSESDAPACRQVACELGSRWRGRVHYIEGMFNHHEIKHLIGQCDFFLGSRMHACIAALSQCVPAVGLAYSRKFAGVLNSVGGGSRVVDLREADEGETLSVVERALEERELLRGELVERMPKIRACVLNLFTTDEFRAMLRPEAR